MREKQNLESVNIANRCKALQDELEESRKEISELKRKTSEQNIGNNVHRSTSEENRQAGLAEELKNALIKIKEQEDTINKLAFDRENLRELRKRHEEEKRQWTLAMEAGGASVVGLNQNMIGGRDKNI